VVCVTEPLGDIVQTLRQLQHDLDAMTRRLEAAAHTGGGMVTGTDATGTVEVDMTTAGIPAGVRLRPDWRDRLGAEGLGAAVVQASTSAVTARLARLATWGAGISEQTDTADTPAPAGLAPAGFTPGDPASRQSQLAIEDLLDLLYDLDDQIPALQAAAETAATTPVQTHNPHHTVTVTTIGGTPTRVDIDTHWAASAHHDHIAGAITDTLIAAHQASNGLREQALGTSPAIERLRHLTASPERLLREIGLIR
jgi:DNA-binding protein YbaB